MTCKPIQIHDDTGRLLFRHARMPSGLLDRARGLIGHPIPTTEEAWWFRACKGVHSLGMRYPIDVVHLDAAGAVLSIRAAMAPFRLSWHPRGRQVLEMQAGRAEALGIRPGVILRRTPCD